MHCRELISVADLSSTERAAFVDAILALKVAPSRISAAATMVTNGGGTPNRYDDYVWMHNTVGSRAHFGSAFGPWHREFLRQFEFDLRQVSGNDDIVIPFWDWTTGRVSGDPNWPFTPDLIGGLGDASGLVTDGPFSDPATWRMNIRRTGDPNTQLRRRPANVGAGFNLPTAINARNGAAYPQPYDASPFNEVFTNATPTSTIQGWINGSFRKFLEWVLHNGVHTWVGGQDNGDLGGPMSFPPVAVNDPVFWLHHCNIDRIWTIWQQRDPTRTYLPVTGGNLGHNLNDEMFHFAAGDAGNFNTPLRGHPTDVLDSRGALEVWYTSDLPLITLVTPSVDFGDVPAGLTTDWPVKFDVRTCRPVKFRISAISGSFEVPAGQADVVVDHDDAHDPARANVFVEFQATGAANVTQSGSVDIDAFIDDDEGYFTGTVGAEYQVGSFHGIGLSARPVPAPRAAVALVLDRSGSMNDSAGPAGTKYDLLRSSLRVIASIMRDDDAIGLVSYDDVVASLTAGEIPMGALSPAGAGRQAVENAITSGDLAPRNETAIGQGMIAGAATLQSVQTDPDYATKAMVVMTDGNENSGPSVTSQAVHDAVAWFADQVYAIGLGDENNVSATTLAAIARYQLITGRITSNEQRFLLTKYFLQILAQIANSAIIVDPVGELRLKEEHRIPFTVADSDVSMQVIALCPVAPLIDVRLEAPDGTIIGPVASANVIYRIEPEVSFYRVLLPALAGNASGTHAGQWTVILRIGDIKPTLANLPPKEAVRLRKAMAEVEARALASVSRAGALPYQVVVQSYSNLMMTVGARQDGFMPGAGVTLQADLKEYLRPVMGAHVVVEVTEPDGREVFVQLSEVAAGRFESTYRTGIEGLYRLRFQAHGVTRGGKPFQREATRTVAVSATLGLSGTPDDGGRGTSDRAWCDLVACLLRRPSIRRSLKGLEIDPREIEACLKRYCSAGHPPRITPGAMKAPVETQGLRRDKVSLREALDQVPAGKSPWEHVIRPAAAVRRVSLPKSRVPKEKPMSKTDDHHHHPLPSSSWTARAGSRESSVLLPST